MRRGARYIFPGEAERDPGFRAEIERLAVRGLWAIGLITLAMPLVSFVFHAIVQIVEPIDPPGGWTLAAFPALGLLAMATARHPWGRRHARLLSLLWGLNIGALLIWAEYYPPWQPESAHLSAALDIIVVLLVAVVATPAKPWQILLLAVGLNWVNLGLSWLAVRWDLLPSMSLHNYAGLEVVALLCTGLSTLSYHRIHETYLAHRRGIEAQSRLLVSENAAALGKFAATISHQLNSPLGALKSSLDTLEKLSQRRGVNGSDHREELESELLAGSRQAASSIEDAVRRMQRFTNLDRAEAFPVDLAQLLRDVAAMVEPEADGRVRIELDCEELPKVALKPQQMSAIFLKLLRNAVVVSRSGETVRLRAGRRNGAIEVRISDRGPGFEPDASQELFEPAFQVRNGKVVGGRWGLFAARQAVLEHGGDISVSSELGEGAEVVVSLPYERPDGAN